MSAALTCPTPVTFTVDVEELATPGDPVIRCPAMTRRLMDFMERHAIRGSFFIDGAVAVGAPGLVREIAARGHEVGSHSFRHVDLVHETRHGFAAGMADAKARLEDLAGHRVKGFRAPRFSLTQRSRWVVDVLGDLGFAYSSSVLPGLGIPFGYRGAPSQPFLWANGLLEIPCPVARFGRLSVACLGGMNLRYLPPWRYRWMMRQTLGQTCWTYCHPHDVDEEAGFRLLPQYGLVRSALLAFNRKITLRRWSGLAQNPASCFADRLEDLVLAAKPFVEAATPAPARGRRLATARPQLSD